MTKKFTPVNLERYQRIYLGLDDEPMDFNEVTVGTMLVDMGIELNDDIGMFVRAVGNAMLGRDEHHIIKISQRKKGRLITPTQRSHRHQETLNVYLAVEKFQLLGLQKKAAVSHVGEIYERSGAWVFAALREREKFAEALESMKESVGEGLLKNSGPNGSRSPKISQNE